MQGPVKVSRRSEIAPFIVMDVMRRAEQRAVEGGDVVHLEVGQPSTSAPHRVIDAARTTLSHDRLGYTNSLGLEALRKRIAQHYQDHYGVFIDWHRVIVTTGSSSAFLLAFIAAFDAGDRVALAAPGYPCYRHILKSLNIEAVSVPVGHATRFQPTPELLDRLDGCIDGLIVASPSNPTGSMLRSQEFVDLVSYCERRGIRLISDEIYHGIEFAERADTALSRSDDAIVINSFSKYFSMTGWRLGWMIPAQELVRPIERLAQNLFISPPTLSQHAAIAAFGCQEELDANVARYAKNREILLDQLPGIGFRQLAPSDGAFYIYADISGRTDDSVEFCQRILQETGVAMTPGVDFDPENGHRWVRISFAGSESEIRSAVERLRLWQG
jgi:aspartate/methionine/tyrosine aminotransferase